MARSSMARPKKSKGMSISTVLSIIIVLLLALGLGLWLLKENALAPTIPVPKQVTVQSIPQNTNLPSRPEEVYSYIRDLETREVITDASKIQEKGISLSKEQLKQLEEKRQQEEAARLLANQSEVEDTIDSAVSEDVELTEQKVHEQKQAEEKRKQAELKKQQELAKKSEEEKNKLKEEKMAASQPKAGSFGLQCGAFKNKAQAENMQARLAMAGFNARIVSGADWNRVFVGPIGNRASAVTAQSNAKSVADCVIVAM